MTDWEKWWPEKIKLNKDTLTLVFRCLCGNEVEIIADNIGYDSICLECGRVFRLEQTLKFRQANNQELDKARSASAQFKRKTWILIRQRNVIINCDLAKGKGKA